MEGHPESSIFSKNQQFEPPQPVAQAWTPTHMMRLQTAIDRAERRFLIGTYGVDRLKI